MVIQIHIRHTWHEPAALLNAQIAFRGVRVHIGRETDVSSGVGRELVYPVAERQVPHPPMLCTAVICHDVHYHLEALFVSSIHHLAIHLVVSETRVDMIIVRAGIAVIRLMLLVVFEERCRPEDRSSQVGNVIQIVYDAPDVAAVPAEEFVFVSRLESARIAVVKRVSISETVRHNQIDKVR